MIIRLPLIKQRKENIKLLRLLIDQYVKVDKKQAVVKIKNEQ